MMAIVGTLLFGATVVRAGVCEDTADTYARIAILRDRGEPLAKIIHLLDLSAGDDAADRAEKEKAARSVYDNQAVSPESIRLLALHMCLGQQAGKP